jgi:hypothetical protein
MNCTGATKNIPLWQEGIVHTWWCLVGLRKAACEWNIMFIILQVSKKNLMEIVKKLMVHMDKAEGTTYRDELLSKIIQICSQNNYQYITNFEWWVLIVGPQFAVLLSSDNLGILHLCNSVSSSV